MLKYQIFVDFLHRAYDKLMRSLTLFLKIEFICMYMLECMNTYSVYKCLWVMLGDARPPGTELHVIMSFLM